MPTQIVEHWDLLRIIQIAIIPAVMIWLKFYLDERQRTMDRRFDAMEKYFQVKLSNIEAQTADIRTELRESRQEARDGRKECAEDVRAIAAQVSEYPRRREFQESVAEIWRAMRSRRGDE
jgi:hypothetical protein